MLWGLSTIPFVDDRPIMADDNPYYTVRLPSLEVAAFLGGNVLSHAARAYGNPVMVLVVYTPLDRSVHVGTLTAPLASPQTGMRP